MLAELETGLVAKLKASALGQRLRQIDSLPDLDGDSLVGRFTTHAPAIYVAMGSFPVKNRYARPKFGVACIARNNRSHHAARHGDGVTIGLYEMLDAVMPLLDGAVIRFGDAENATEVGFEVIGCDLVASEALFQKGVYAGVVQLQATAEVCISEILADLSDFKTFAADFDIEPHQASSERDKWLQEPPDHTTSAPELSDTLKLQE